jgi:hypothetical protein
MPALTHELVTKAVEDHTWDFANSVLYRLCKEHPDHTREEVIIAKVWLIGRAYAAAVERRRDVGDSVGDDFYTKRVGPCFRDLDPWFFEFKNHRLSVLQLHKKITDLLKRLAGLEKRSFTSKYLHFHFPGEYFIYDSYSDTSARKILRESGIRRQPRADQADFDLPYADFFARCEYLSQKVSELLGRHPSPRELDKVLLLHWRVDALRKRAAGGTNPLEQPRF